MAGSSPADLAVTFRSIDRRLREALDGEPRDRCRPVAGLVAQLVPRSASAASTMGVAGARRRPRRHRERRGRRIDRVPADEWDDAQLECLRAAALDAGRVLRTIAEQTEH